jgi:hypothetical protein
VDEAERMHMIAQAGFFVEERLAGPWGSDKSTIKKPA